MSMRARTLLGVALLANGCRTIPLNEDPTMPRSVAHVSHPALFDVDWVAPLVKLGLLEYRPTEPASPAVDVQSERLIVTTRDGQVRCLSPIDGKIEWEFKTRGRFVGGPVVLQGVVYVPGGDGFLYALDVLTGQKKWEYHANEELVSTPTIAGDLILVASQSETVFAVSVQTGQWIWQYRRDLPSGFAVRGTAQPTVDGDSVYMGFADGYLVSLELATGVARWEKKLALSGGAQFVDVDTTPVVSGGRVYAASYGFGLLALEASTGDILWSTTHPGITSLGVDSALVYASGDGALTAFDVRNGKQSWTLNLSDPVSKGKAVNSGRALSLVKDYILVPTSTALAFVDKSNRRVVSMWNPGRGVTATPTAVLSELHGSHLYVLSNLGTVFNLHLRW